MLIWNPSKLTTKGKALLAKAQAGRCTIKITKAQTGSGQYSSGEATDTRTSLKAPVQTLPIHSKEIQNGSTLVLKVAITNKTSDTDVLKSGYEIREFGIFAQDPDDGEILYSIATASTSDYMPAYNGVIPSVISMSYYLEVANAASVTIVTAGGLALQSDLEALADRVTIIEQAAVKKYGARKKVGQQSCGAESWERLGGAVGLTAKAAVGTGDVQNDFMKSVYPYNACRPCNLSEDRKVTAYLGDANFSWTGDNGDVMLEMPLCYTSRYFETDSDGVEWEYRWVSSAPVDGLHVNPAFTDGSSISDKIYIPIFNGSAGKDAATGAKDVIRSIAGATPLTEVTRATFRTRSRNKGEGWQLDDVWNMFLLDHLFIIMFAGTQAQRILGSGRTEFRENENDKALKAKKSTNCITIASDKAAYFFVGQQIAIGTGMWFDCSAAVIQACENAGIPVKSKGATYTGNMLAVFKKCGFVDVTSKVNRSTGAGLLRGDVLLNTSHHTAMYCGNGKEVEASINEKGTATGGKPGDQTGKEFLIRSYRNYPWTNVLRYAAESQASGSGKKDVTTVAKEVLAGTWGNGDERKNRLTAAGYDYAAVQAEVNRLASGASTPKKSTTEIAKEVLAGKWGNGDDRKKKLQAAGYNYAAVQAEVNRLAKGGSSTKKSVTAVAKEVLAGKWGNGDARKKKLQAAGYNYNAVQKEVNRLMR